MDVNYFAWKRAFVPWGIAVCSIVRGTVLVRNFGELTCSDVYLSLFTVKPAHQWLVQINLALRFVWRFS